MHSIAEITLESGVPEFIAHRDLKNLAKRLRMLGFDCQYDGGMSTSGIIADAIENKRLLLTNKPLLPTARLKTHRFSSEDTVVQLRELNQLYNLSERAIPFSRCIDCNMPFIQIEQDDTEKKIPASIRKRRLEVVKCPECSNRFWHGSHVERMIKLIKESGIIIENTG